MLATTATQQQVRQRQGPEGGRPDPLTDRSARITHAPTGMVSIGDGYMMKDEARGQEDKTPLVYQDRTDYVAKRRHGMAGRTVQRTMLLLKRHKRRIELGILIAMFVMGAVLCALMAVGGYILWWQEKCRFPTYSYTETFIYNIDFKYTNSTWVANPTGKEPGATTNAGGVTKMMTVTGPKLDLAQYTAAYGSATITAVNSTDVTYVKVDVTNRALTKSAIYGMTDWTFEDLTFTAGEGAAAVSERRTQMKMASETNNKRTGQFHCQRADVTITLPGACMLQDTTVTVNVDKAQALDVKDSVSQANVKQLNVQNSDGPITVAGAVGEKLVFQTGNGTINATNMSGHQIFLSGTKDGALVFVSDVHLETGDANCKEGVVYQPGFPQTAQYGTAVMLCDKVPGTLTIDTQGADNGGKPALTISQVYAGNITAYIKVGNVEFTQTACTTYVGDYDLKTASGTLAINVDQAPVGSYPIQLDGSSNNVQTKLTSTKNFGQRPDEAFYFWTQYNAGSNERKGNICGGFVGVPATPVLTASIEARTTGNITMNINQTYVVKK